MRTTQNLWGSFRSAASLPFVIVKNGLTYVGINTSESYVNPTGKLVVIDLETKEVARETDLGGQPDSVVVTPDGSFVAVAIENERNEDIND